MPWETSTTSESPAVKRVVCVSSVGPGCVRLADPQPLNVWTTSVKTGPVTVRTDEGGGSAMAEAFCGPTLVRDHVQTICFSAEIAR